MPRAHVETGISSESDSYNSAINDHECHRSSMSNHTQHVPVEFYNRNPFLRGSPDSASFPSWEQPEISAKDRPRQIELWGYPPGWNFPAAEVDRNVIPSHLPYPRSWARPPIQNPGDGVPPIAVPVTSIPSSPTGRKGTVEIPGQPLGFMQSTAYQNADTIYRAWQHPKDVSIRLEMDEQEDLSADLEEFGQLHRLGQFRKAKSFFRQRLIHRLDDPYVFTLYSTLLFDAGDLKTLATLQTEDMQWHAIRPGAAALLRVNWELMAFLGNLPGKLSPGRLLEVVFDTIAYMRSSARWGSTEIQILHLSMKCVEILHQSGRLQGTSATQVESFRSIIAEISWREIYDRLLSDGHVWDFRDLFVSIVRFQGWAKTSEVFFGEQTTPTVLNRLIDDWQSFTYDESTALAILDIVSTCILEETAISAAKARVSSCLRVAESLAKSIVRNGPEQMRSRPFVKWMLSKAFFDQFSRGPSPLAGDRDGNRLSGLLLQGKNGVHLPIYVPRDGENPGWTTFNPVSRSIDNLSIALQTCRELEDYTLEVICLKLMSLRSQDPRKHMNDILERQKTVLHDKAGYLQTLLSSYLLITSDRTGERLLELITSTDFQPDHLDISKLDPELRDDAQFDYLDPTILWARDMLIVVLARNQDGPSQTAVDSYYSPLPAYVKDYFSQKVPSVESPPVKQQAPEKDAALPAKDQSVSAAKKADSLIVEEVLSDRTHQNEQRPQAEPVSYSPVHAHHVDPALGPDKTTQASVGAAGTSHWKMRLGLDGIEKETVEQVQEDDPVPPSSLEVHGKHKTARFQVPRKRHTRESLELDISDSDDQELRRRVPQNGAFSVTHDKDEDYYPNQARRLKQRFSTDPTLGHDHFFEEQTYFDGPEELLAAGAKVFDAVKKERRQQSRIFARGYPDKHAPQAPMMDNELGTAGMSAPDDLAWPMSQLAVKGRTASVESLERKTPAPREEKVEASGSRTAKKGVEVANPFLYFVGCDPPTFQHAGNTIITTNGSAAPAEPRVVAGTADAGVLTEPQLPKASPEREKVESKNEEPKENVEKDGEENRADDPLETIVKSPTAVLLEEPSRKVTGTEDKDASLTAEEGKQLNPPVKIDGGSSQNLSSEKNEEVEKAIDKERGPAL